MMSVENTEEPSNTSMDENLEEILGLMKGPSSNDSSPEQANDSDPIGEKIAKVMDKTSEELQAESGPEVIPGEEESPPQPKPDEEPPEPVASEETPPESEKTTDESEPVDEYKTKYEALVEAYAKAADQMATGKAPETPAPDGVDKSEWEAFQAHKRAESNGAVPTPTVADPNAPVIDTMDQTDFVATLSEDDFTQTFQSQQVQNDLLNKVKNEAIKEMMILLPPMVVRQVAFEGSTKTRVDQFWAANPDLKDPLWEKIVGMRATQFQQANPNWGVDEICTAVGNELGPLVARAKAEGQVIPKEPEKIVTPGRPVLPGSIASTKPAIVKEEGLPQDIRELFANSQMLY